MREIERQEKQQYRGMVDEANLNLTKLLIDKEGEHGRTDIDFKDFLNQNEELKY